MSKSTDRGSVRAAPDAIDDDPVAGLTRRTVLAGAAAATAAVTMRVDIPALAQIPDDPDMEAFKNLSAALTGVAKARLTPDTDPVDVKKEYFAWVKGKEPAAFAALLQIATNAKATLVPGGDGIIAQDAVDKLVKTIEAKDDTKFLARSIVLMWYLGSWYEPNDLRNLTRPNPPTFISHTVISPKAYTQGWLWRVAQAHPMGYSDLQFGYWTRDPQPREEFITKREIHKRPQTKGT